MMTRIFSTRFCFTVCLLLLSMTVVACGVKPDKVDPPPGSQDTVFPSTYPRP
ncbi:MAG: hypothetical protein KJ667_04340 [Alphaproteobacteria bacterium]|nr:hypothetical protein [Alphaproteobacteria bacterium]